jgi:tetratricopeptide (TPR) repeat protein
MQEPLSEVYKLYREEKFEEAIEELLETEGSELDFEEVAYYLGLCYTRLERYEEALLFLEQVVTAGTSIKRRNQCRFALAYVYTLTDRNRLAEFELNQLIRSGAKSAQVYAALGYAAYLQGKVSESLDFYGKALEMDPENPNALNSFGYILAEEGVDLQRALTYCRKALDVKPNNPAYLDSLGWAYYRLGALEDALSYLTRAAELAPKRDIIREHLSHLKGDETT